MSPPWKQNPFQKAVSEFFYGKPTPEQQRFHDSADASERMMAMHRRAREEKSRRVKQCGYCHGRSCEVHSHRWLSDPKENFRILELEKGVGKEAIHVKMKEVDIEEEKNYETLSYRWEDIEESHDPRDVAHIHIDTKVFPVSNSVLEALYILRRSDRSRRLWIDQICIVQEGSKSDSYSDYRIQRQKAEMDGQLTIMGRIYSLSKRTLIWLGPNITSDETRALRWIVTYKPFREQVERLVDQHEQEERAGTGCQHASRAEHALWKQNLVTGLSLLDIETLRKKGITEAMELWMSEETIDCILKFYQRSWFVRTWPVQEVVLSKEKTVYIGDQKLRWSHIGWFAAYFIHKNRHLDIEPDKLAGLEAAMWVHFYAGAYTDGFPLSAMLRATRRYKTGDPKDKVYAILGMIDFSLSADGSRYSTCTAPIRTIPSEIDVDKSKSATQAYYDVAKYLLKKDQHLQILAAREFIPISEDLPTPSWVPRWDKKEEQTHIWLPTPGAENFNTCSQLDEWIRCDNVSRGAMSTCILTLHGAKLARVTQVFDYMGGWDNVAQIISQMAEANVGRCEDPLAEIAMVLTAGRAEHGQIVDMGKSDNDLKSRQHVEHFTGLMMDLAEYEGELDRTGQGEGFRVILRMAKERRGQLHYTPGEMKKSLYGIWCQEALRSRSIFRTDSGRFGVGPACMRVDDDVYILRGGKVPFILRTPEDHSLRFGGSHQLVGECYVRGAMNEEFDGMVRRLGPHDGEVYLV